MIKTSDLCDRYAAEIGIAEPIFKDYGGELAFSGPIVTIQVYEDNVLIRRAMEEPGEGCVLVIDGGGSLRRALVGDIMASLAKRNGWGGILINGCIRDAVELGRLPIGIKALNSMPLRPKKEGKGQRDVPVQFAGVTFAPGHYLYADADGVVVSSKELSLDH